MGDLFVQQNLGGKYSELSSSRIVKLEMSSERQSSFVSSKSAKRTLSSSLEKKLDEFRKEISSSQGGMFPHAVLSAQQISILGAQKPTSIEQLEKLIGKLKTEKYGSRIIDLIQQYIKSEQQGTDEQEVTRNNARRTKRPRSGDPIFVESSDEEK
ncbi:hypothetical protein Taro_008073 [Colocasia esculenta]|uniref:HRDC domain-containing protein n=1 Tax=Colocasia esculenta TaxID=4460 RepID=A0A843U037_COLES|nr:hypothetical protein [Colocasia esculenta]